MAKTPWIPAAVALTLALGLAGCGDNGEEAGVPEVDEAEAPAVEQPEETMPEAPVPEGDEEALAEDDESALVPDDDVEADTETLGESPAETIEEGAALPGETTPDEIDAIIEEQERRFEEAQRRIEEQFDAVEETSPLEPMEDTTDFETTLEPLESDPLEERETPSTIDEEAAMPGETTASDIEALLEETERRFEEAQRRLDEQFEEAERRDPLTDDPQELEEFDDFDFDE
jgi:hypothetical protein